MPQTPVYSPSGGAIIPQNGSQPISVAGLATSATPLNIPAQPSVDNGSSTNVSIPTPQSIVASDMVPTDADNTQSTLLNKIAALTGNQTSLSTNEINQENAAGVPALAQSVTDLNAQLQGLNDQSSKLQLDASANGTIDNNAQNSALGRGVTTGGLQPITTAALRNNQIQQAGIAAQSLTTKSALYAAQGQYSLAKDAADKAAQVAFDSSQQEINHQQALLAAIQPTLDKEQSARAATLSAQLADRQTQINNQRDDFKTGQALAVTAMQNNPNDPAAQYAAQQALKLDPTDPQYLQKVSALVGQYQDNQTKAALDNKLEQAQIANTQENTANTANNIKLSGGGGNDTSQLVGTTGQSAIDVTSEGYSTTPVSGAGGLSQAAIDQAALQYALTGKMPSIGLGSTGAAGAKKTAILNRAAELNSGGNIAANAAQVKSLSSALSTQQGYLSTQTRALDTAENGFQQVVSAFGDKVNLSSFPSLNAALNASAKQLNPGEVSAFKAGLQEVSNEYATVFSKNGTQTDAVRGKAADIVNGNLSIDQLNQVLTELQAQGKTAIDASQSQVTSLQNQLNNIISPSTSSSSTNGQIQVNGQSYSVGQIYQDASGAKWTVDANGKWTKQ